MTDRRVVLQVAAVSVLGLTALPACSRSPEDPAAPAAPDPQQADEAALIALYDAALGVATPAQAAVWQPIRDAHAAHLAALGWQGAPPSSSPAAVGFKRSDLAKAERAAMRMRTVGAREAQDAEQAQILALIAASEAQHAAVLDAQ